MAESHVISALVSKRSELLGEIKHHETLIATYRENLVAVDKTIHIFDSSYDLRTVKATRVSKERYFKTGEAKVYLLDALRLSNSPMRTDSLVDVVAKTKGIVLKDDYERQTFQKTIVASLDRIEKSGLIERAGREGLTMIWKIKERSQS